MSGIFGKSSAELHIFKNKIADGFIETVCKIAVGHNLFFYGRFSKNRL
jgi:hypothetical protein